MTPSLPESLAEAAHAHPDLVAAQVVDGPSLTYLAWHERSDVHADALCESGISAGGRVALLFDTERWTQYAVAYMAVVKAGAIPVPLSAELSSLEVARALRACGATAVIAPGELGRIALPVPHIDPAVLERPVEHRRQLPAPAETAEIIVRSRPLSPPVLQSRTAETVAAGSSLPIEAAGRNGALLHWWPVGSLPGQDALCAALRPRGVRSVVLSEYDPVAIRAALRHGAITACSLHPAIAEALLHAVGSDAWDGALRSVILASGRVSPEFLQRFADLQPTVRVLVAEPADEPPAAASWSPSGQQTSAPYDVNAVVTAVWRRVLACDEVAPGDNFFDSGGDGVRATRLLRLVEDALGVRLAVGAFLDEPTPTGLTALASRALAHQAGRVLAPDSPPAAFSQEGMVWHECFAPGCQNLPGLARRFTGAIDVEALTRALDEIVRRHEPLRSTFAVEDGCLRQVVHPPGPVPLRRSDISHLPPHERDAEVERLIADAGNAPFDLVDGPLFEPNLVRLADDDHVLIIRTHHSVFDDWSVGVFRRQLAAAYQAYAAGRGVPPFDSSMTFGAFAREQRRSHAGDAGAREIRYWANELRDAPLTTQLAVQNPHAPEGSPQPPGGPITLTFPADVRTAVRALAGRERSTVFMVLLAAFGAVVSMRTGQHDLLLSTVVANRNRTNLERLIGCFTKKVPLRLDLRGDPAFTEVLSRVRRSLLGALQHQDLPFEAVVQEVLGPRAEVHGLVPHIVVMVQGVTPRQELVIPDVQTTGFETSSRAARAHFMSASAERPASAVWGGGIYLGTFVILSVFDGDDELSCTARGAFHGPAVESLLDDFSRVVASASSAPSRRLSALAGQAPPATRDAHDAVDIDGFRVDIDRMTAALSRCPGIRRAAVRRRDDGDGAPRLVAEIVPDGAAPSADSVRRCLWGAIPGYAWPASVNPRQRSENATPLDCGAETALLGAIWAEVLGIDHCRPQDNYWQDFSFLETLARARDAGVRIRPALIARNRTLRTLGVALAADHSAAVNA